MRSALIWLRRIFGETAFATWEEAELLEVPMVSERGTADVRELGVEPVADAAGARGRLGLSRQPAPGWPISAAASSSTPSAIHSTWSTRSGSALKPK